MRGISAIIKKELTRVFSDKKLIVSLFILPVVLIVGIYSIMGKMQSNMQSDIEEHIGKVYIQNAPEDFNAVIDKVHFKADIEMIGSDSKIDSIKEEIKNGKVEMLVVFPEDMNGMIADYEVGNAIPEVKTYYNPSEDYSSNTRNNFVNIVLPEYRNELLATRLGSLDIIRVFDVDLDTKTSEILDESKASNKMFSMLLPYLITLLLFAGVMSLGIDAITGEKERGTMASMLLTPVKRREIVFGKIFALSILSSLSAAVYALGMIIAMPMMLKNMTDDSSMMKLSFTPIQGLQLILIMLVLVVFYVAIVSLAAVMAKTAKEASTYVTPIYLVVLVAGMLTMFIGNKVTSLFTYVIPVYGSAVSIKDLLLGELTWAKFGLNIGGTVVLTLILVALITKAFNSEKVMFNA